MARSETSFKSNNRAAVTHGGHAIKARGVEAMTPDQRSERQQLLQDTQTHEGALNIFREEAVENTVLARILRAYVKEKKEAGEDITKLTLWKFYLSVVAENRRYWREIVPLLPKESERTAADIINQSLGDEIT